MKAYQIVLIEDNPADVLLIELAMEECNLPFEITRYRDGEEAVDALCSSSGSGTELQPDAILLDLNTPRSDGFEVLGKSRGNPRLAQVPIAIISSSQAKSDKHRTNLLGALWYIEKPSQAEDFLKTVGSAIKELLEAGDMNLQSARPDS